MEVNREGLTIIPMDEPVLSILKELREEYQWIDIGE